VAAPIRIRWLAASALTGTRAANLATPSRDRRRSWLSDYDSVKTAFSTRACGASRQRREIDAAARGARWWATRVRLDHRHMWLVTASRAITKMWRPQHDWRRVNDPQSSVRRRPGPSPGPTIRKLTSRRRGLQERSRRPTSSPAASSPPG
jgi:hypothetical protein